MRVKITQDVKVFHGHVPTQLVVGQEVKGELAALLLRQAPQKVKRLDADTETAPPDPDAAIPAAELDITAPAAQVLAWVGDDPERAAEALAAEQAQEKPRSTLVKALQKVAGNSGE